MLTRMWSNRNSHLLLIAMQNGTVIWEDHFRFLTKLNMFLPYDLAIVLLSIYAKGLKTYVHTKP